MKKRTFKEKQTFNDAIVYTIIAFGILQSLLLLTKSLATGTYVLEKDLVYLIIIVFLGSTIFGLRRLKLKLSVNEKRIKYKMTPFQSKSKRILWNNVESCEIIKTPLTAQWHGSNLSFGGEAWFSLSGRTGLSIKTKDGQKLFIGCKNVDELKKTIEKIDL